MQEDKPYISVVITAYDRKVFLLNAIKSVLRQTLDKTYYEIIVIKNFKDDNIDDFIKKNKVIGIISNEESLSGKLVEALNIARGTVISFLEDDDSFLENKLDIVYNEFIQDSNVVYYHNLCVYINENGKSINNNLINPSPDFNMSSISIKKSIVKIKNNDKTNILPDTSMYLYALESNKKIINGKEKLTYYMFHKSASHIVAINFEEYRKQTLTIIEETLETYRKLKELCNLPNSINFINARMTGFEINGYIYGRNEKPNNLINYILNYSFPLKLRIKFLSAYILIKINHNFRQYIQKKIWRNDNKRSINL